MLLQLGYIWLIAASGYWFALRIRSRPGQAPYSNHQSQYLRSRLAGRRPVHLHDRGGHSPHSRRAIEQIGKEPIALTRVQEGATAVVNYQTGITDLDRADTKFWISAASRCLCTWRS